MIQPIAASPLPAPRRWRTAVLLAALALAGCATAPPSPVAPGSPGPKPGVPAGRPGATAPVQPGTGQAQPAPPAPGAAKPAPPESAPTVAFVRGTWAELPGWSTDRVEEAWPALGETCRALGTRPEWSDLCAKARTVDRRDRTKVRVFFEANFTPHRVRASDGADSGLVTGYYEPLLAGSRTRTARFRFPVHAPPDDLLTVDLGELYPELKDKRVRGRIEGRRVVPYYPRADIEAGRARTSGKEIAWVEDAVDLFFLQIQGSGRIRLADGSTMRVGYADQNGHPYRSVGRALVERGELTVEQASMAGIKQWVVKNPDRAAALLNENPSYVFFRELAPNPPGSPDGPLGALGVPLTAGRSVAVDRTTIPLGTPLFLSTTHPGNGTPLQRLVVAQDTGGAIRGPMRIDLFWGFGEDAGREAGRMRNPGQVWMLWPNGVQLPNAPPAV